MSLFETLRKDMFEAKKNNLVEKSNILGMAIASINNYKIEVQRDITDEDVVTILRKEQKKLKESFEQFTSNGREDLAKIEKIQLDTISSYLPELLGEEEVEKIVKQIISTMGDVTIRDMGKIMGVVMAENKGKVDGNTVSNVVKKILGA